MRDKPKQIHLAVVYAVGSNHSLSTHSQPGTHIDFSSFAHIAQTAERGKFDFFFLTELLRLREKGPRTIADHDVAGSPNIMAILAGLAAVTTHLGLVATDNVTFNEPYDLARQMASLDHLSGGRVGWNVVTTNADWVGENFRRGGYLDYDDRYLRAGEFLDVARRRQRRRARVQHEPAQRDRPEGRGHRPGEGLEMIAATQIRPELTIVEQLQSVAAIHDLLAQLAIPAQADHRPATRATRAAVPGGRTPRSLKKRPHPASRNAAPAHTCNLTVEAKELRGTQARGSSPAAGPGRRLRCGWPRRVCPGHG